MSFHKNLGLLQAYILFYSEQVVFETKGRQIDRHADIYVSLLRLIALGMLVECSNHLSQPGDPKVFTHFFHCIDQFGAF